MYDLEFWKQFENDYGNKFTIESEWRPAIFYDGITQDSIEPNDYENLEFKINETKDFLIVVYTQIVATERVYTEILIQYKDIQEVHLVKVEDIVEEKD